jgi:urease accessory protein
MSAVFDAEEGEKPLAPGSAGKDGELRLVFAIDGGRSYVAHDYARVPFHLTRGMYPDPERDDVVFVYVQNPTGATVQGDRTTAEIVAREGSTAHVTTGSAQKVHTMDAGHAEASTTLRVEEDGYIEYVPDPTILHDGARYDTATELHVAEGGAAVVSDIVVAGRRAHGESFGFDAYRSSVTGYTDGTLLFDDTTEVDDATETGGRSGAFDGYGVFGDLYVVAPDADVGALRDEVAEMVADTDAENDAVTGVTRLPNEAGVVARFVAGSVPDARTTKRAAWDGARRRLIDSPVPPRRR